MNLRNYNPFSETSVVMRARELRGRTIAALCMGNLKVVRPRGKEGVGNILEAYFGIQKNNAREPDFPCGIELKTAPLRKDGTPKYPLTIGMIDYEELKREHWFNAHVKRKLSKILLIFYEEGREFLKSRIRHVFLWHPTREDWMLLEADWKKIQEKVRSGEADKLSEKDTLFLVARRKGSKGEMRQVREGGRVIEAKSRCFALKRRFLDFILARELTKARLNEGSLIRNLGIKDGTDFIGRVIARSRQYWGLSISEIERKLGLELNKNAKSYAAQVVYHALGLRKGEAYAREFKAAGISVKTVRCNPGLRPIYAMSLRGYRYEDIVDEKWETSRLKEDVERMLLVVLTLPQKGAPQAECRLESIFLFEPSEDDLRIMREDWETLVDMVRRGEAHKLTGRIGRIIQTRPKAATGQDTIPAPGGRMLVKKGFFIRTDYLYDVLRTKMPELIA